MGSTVAGKTAVTPRWIIGTDSLQLGQWMKERG